MQEYKDIDIDSLVSDGPDTINKNFKTLMSNNAGGEFPTENLYAGMICYRSDEGKTYTLKNDLTTWVELFDVSGANGAVTPKADALTKTLTVAEGGTGATTGSAACSNIGAVQTVNDTAPDENGNVNVAGVPVGFEYFTTNPNIPAGSLPLFGGEYSRATYQDLWNWVQLQSGYLLTEDEWQIKSGSNDGNVPFYSTGDGITTFRVPSLKCWVKGANGIEEVGSYLSAGLPNITGAIESRPHTSGNARYGGAVVGASGAFTYTRMASTAAAESGCAESKTQSSCDVTTFSAQTSNPIYGNSDTVQPKSIVGMWLVKAYGTVTNVGSTDVASIAQGLTELETNKLSLSGGTMTGTIKVLPHLTGFSGHNSIEIENGKGKEIQLAVKDNNLQYSFLSIHSTEDVTTPDGTTHNGGAIIAGLSNGTDLVFFEMNPKGKMVFNGFYLSINSIGDNYIRYDNGIQICWGYVESPATNAVITFPVPFLKNNGYGLSADFGTTNWKAESFQLRGQISWLTWLAIGRWK